MSKQQTLFDPPVTLTDRRVLAMVRKGRKYKSARKYVKVVRGKQAHYNWLAQ